MVGWSNTAQHVLQVWFCWIRVRTSLILPGLLTNPLFSDASLIYSISCRCIQRNYKAKAWRWKVARTKWLAHYLQRYLRSHHRKASQTVRSNPQSFLFFFLSIFLFLSFCHVIICNNVELWYILFHVCPKSCEFSIGADPIVLVAKLKTKLIEQKQYLGMKWPKVCTFNLIPLEKYTVKGKCFWMQINQRGLS